MMALSWSTVRSWGEHDLVMEVIGVDDGRGDLGRTVAPIQPDPLSSFQTAR